MKSNKTSYESSDAKTNLIVITIVVAGLTILLIVILSTYLYRGLVSNRIKQLEESSPMYSTDFHKRRMQEEHDLKTYKWIHKEKGRLQIPIDEAMDQVVESYQTSNKHPVLREVPK